MTAFDFDEDPFFVSPSDALKSLDESIKNKRLRRRIRGLLDHLGLCIIKGGPRYYNLARRTLGVLKIEVERHPQRTKKALERIGVLEDILEPSGSGV